MNIDQNETREQIARQVAEYIQKGGVITIVPHEQVARDKLPMRLPTGGNNYGQA